MRYTVLAAIAALSLASISCTTDAPDETKKTPAEAPVEDVAPEPEPVREELAIIVTAHAVATYTLALNKTTGVRMEQIHSTETAKWVFPADHGSVASFAFADGRAVELAISKSFRMDDGPVKLGDCLIRVNWNLDRLGYDQISCGDFVNVTHPYRINISSTPDQDVSLVVESVEVTPDPRLADGAKKAVIIEDKAFGTNAWHSDAGAWRFEPASVSVDSVVKPK